VTFGVVDEAAAEVRRQFDDTGVVGVPRTTGNRGLHVYVRPLPERDGYQVRAAAVAVARELERRRPEERGTRVFVDLNQSAPHKTVVGAWCVRANAHAQVSAPFGLNERATLATVPARVAAAGNPWATMADRPQSLGPLLELHRADMAAGLMDAPWPPRVAPSRARQPES